MPTRDANATWTGDLKSGNGQFKGASGHIAGEYSFKTRFEDDRTATNPEELLAAAHAACFSMAFSNELDGAGHTPDSVNTTAKVNLKMGDDGPQIDTVHLECTGTVPGIEDAEFQKIAEAAKAGCPVSKLFAGAKITLDATLAS